LATATAPAPVQREVDWETYCLLRDDPANDHLRMDYLDGTLTIMSPDPIHEEAADLLALVVRGTAAGLGIAIKGLRTTTLRRGITARKGSGKDPDNAFYLGPHVVAMSSFRKLRKAKLDLDVDRPPDLAIEVDHSRNSAGSLPTYASLGVPEVWRYDVEDDTLRFFRLADNAYLEVDRSVVLPVLTPDLVAYLDQIRDWARDLPQPGR
jgi:Uma2 family endonuclease